MEEDEMSEFDDSSEDETEEVYRDEEEVLEKHLHEFKARVPYWRSLEDDQVPTEIKTKSKYDRLYGTYR